MSHDGLRRSLGLAQYSTLLERLVLVTGLFGVATVGNSVLLCAARVLFAMGRAGLAPAWFASTHPRPGATDHSLAVVVALAAAVLLAGREGIGPIVAVGAVCLALGYLATSAAVVRLRRTDADRPRPYRVPLGGLIAPAATLGSLGLVGAALYGPLAASGGSLPGEWLVLALWTVAGIGTWRLSARMRAAIPEADRRRQLLGE